MNVFESLIEWFSPQTALERERARMAAGHLRSYDGAQKGRRTSSWTTTGMSQNAELLGAAQTLRNRSRELSRNNPYVKRAVQSISNNIIGKGIQAKIKTKNKRQRDKINVAWRKWFRSTECDFDGIQTGNGIQKLVTRAVIESGGCLILKRRNKGKSIPLELQVLEIDYLDVSKNSPKLDNGGFIFMGIEFDSEGRKKQYWLFDKHPGDSFSVGSVTSSPRPATDVIHVFEQLRPGQQVGVPFGVSAFLRVRDMDEYNDAQVVRQKIAACYTVFLSGEGAGLELATEDAEELERIEPGMIHRVQDGETVTFGSPPTVENFGEFSRTILQGVAAGFGTTYENLTGDLSNVNFSSGRMGWIEHHRNIEDWQENLIIPQFLQAVWGWFSEAAQLSVGIPNDATVEWTPPRREMIDPAKEVKGITAMIRSGLLSQVDAIRQQGFDPEEMVAEITEWNSQVDGAEIILDTDPRHGKGEQPDGRGRPTNDGKNVDDNEDKK